MHIAVCGGGVIGAAAAYELASRGASVTLIERWKVGGCASGKSGGFLARDWCGGTPVAPLAERSFDLHAKWAGRLGTPYGYRTVDTFSAVLSPRFSSGGGAGQAAAKPAWLAPEAADRRQLGNATTTAQLDPEAFTRALAGAAVKAGATLEIGAVASLSETAGRITGVELEGGRSIEADAVILALGPWSLLAAKWLPLPPVYGLKGHSIILKPERPLPAEVIFAEVDTGDGDVYTPEIISRADGTVYVCGLPGTGGLPVDPSRVLPESGGAERLRDITLALVPALASAPIIAEQACYRPVTADGMPLIGAIEGYEGAYVATGHSVWGMLNAPGTAEALAELLLDGAARTVDLAPFAPSRMAPLDPADLEMRATD